MAQYSVLQAFYTSVTWGNFRLGLIAERGLRCESCGERVAKSSDLTLHHTTELTPENVHDHTISLNPDKIMVVHHDCHNKIHNRFGYSATPGVHIVYGPPLSGKADYVCHHMGRGDIVVDMDRLYTAVSMLPYYDKPDSLFGNVISIHNLLIDNIKIRLGKWCSAWIIGGYADKFKRERLAIDIGADLVFCNISREECLMRLEVDENRRYRKEEWKTYIDKWFEQYQS